MTARAAVRKDDVKRAVAGVQAAGLMVGRVRVSPLGVIEIDVAEPGAPRKGNSWDDVLD